MQWLIWRLPVICMDDATASVAAATGHLVAMLQGTLPRTMDRMNSRESMPANTREESHMDHYSWLTAADPDEMLRHLKVPPSERQRCLLACAWCRRVWHLLGHKGCRRAVETAERYADGLITAAELVGVCPGVSDFARSSQAAGLSADNCSCSCSGVRWSSCHQLPGGNFSPRRS